MISDKERELRMAIVKRVAIELAQPTGDPILQRIELISKRTSQSDSAGERTFDELAPIAVAQDGGRFFPHVRMDGTGQIEIRWPNGAVVTIKFRVPDESLLTTAQGDEIGKANRSLPSNLTSPSPGAPSPEEFADIIHAAGIIRAYELVQKSHFSPSQAALFLANYRGRYSKEIFEAGLGLLLTIRDREQTGLLSWLRRLFGKSKGRVSVATKVETAAKVHLLSHGVRKQFTRDLRQGFKN